MKSQKEFRAKAFVTEVVRVYVAPVLAEVGYRKSGNLFRRESDRWCDVVSIQMNRWGSAESSSVGMHVGVWWREIQELARPRSVSRKPNEYDCTVRARFGRVVSGRQQDWPVDRSTTANDLGREMAQAMKRRVLPWIDSAHVIENLLTLRWMEPPMYANEEAATLHLLGRKREVAERMRDYYAVYGEDPKLHSDFIGFAKRLGFERATLEALSRQGRGQKGQARGRPICRTADVNGTGTSLSPFSVAGPAASEGRNAKRRGWNKPQK